MIYKGIAAQTGDNTPLICGYNPGQHLYLDAGAYSTNEASLKFILGGNFEANWNILVEYFNKIRLISEHLGEHFISGVDDRVFLTETAPPGMSPVPDWSHGNCFII